MATLNVNGVRLFYDLSGTGDIPLVFVHGSWSSHHTWDLVRSHLAEPYRVLTYDRRGHSQSERPLGQGSVGQDVADLSALIEELGLAPAWVVGNSFGASISLRLAAEHPELLRGLIVHEPPLFSLLGDSTPVTPMREEDSIGAVLERIASGDHAGGAELFAEAVVGPGSWAHLDPEIRQVMIENAPTFLDEERDPETHVFDPEWVKRFAKPVLITLGEQSSPPFAAVTAALSQAISSTEVITLEGVGHIPHLSHPDVYTEVVVAFVRMNSVLQESG